MVYSTNMEFNRSTCDCPGPILQTGPNSLVFYFPHPSGTCTIAAWWPATNYQNAPWICFWRGGLGFNPGERSSYDLQSFGVQQVAQYFASLGYVVFSIDYPGVSSNRDDGQGFNEIHPLAMWPEQIFLVATSLMFIRDNAKGDTSTRYGTRLLGLGNTIDPRFGCVYGVSWGFTLAAMCALTPDWMMPRLAAPALTQEPWRFKSSHRLPCWAGFEGQIDLTQLDIEPAGLTGIGAKPDYPLGEIYMNDRAQWLMRTESTRKWSTTPIEQKKMSPWWLLKRNYPENANTTFFCQWPATASPDGAIPEEANLTAEDFVPGKLPTANDRLAGKAQRSPHHNFQAKPWRDALLTYPAATVPNVRSPIRQSVVRWGNATTNPGNAFLQGDTFAKRLNTHLKTVCGFPK